MASREGGTYVKNKDGSVTLIQRTQPKGTKPQAKPKPVVKEERKDEDA